MRVDFLASFAQVQKLVSAKTAQAQTSSDFSSILESSKAPNLGQPVEIIKENPPTASLVKLATEQPRARYDQSNAQLLVPLPQALNLKAPVGEQVKETSVGVKTPSGIGGRFVKIEDPFAGLDKSEKKAVVGRLVSMAGAEYGINPALSLSVIKAESNFNPIAVSSDGFESKGLMQLLDSTGKDMMARLGVEQNYTPFDPEQNIELGVGYLKRLHDLFQTSSELGGNLRTVAAANSSSLEKLAVAAYNAGEGRVASAQQRAIKAGKDPAFYENVERYLPEITREYVKHVLSNRNELIELSKG